MQISAKRSNFQHIGRMSTSQLEGWVFDPRPLSKSSLRSLGSERSPQPPRQKSLDQASACSQLSLNIYVALHAIIKNR